MKNIPVFASCNLPGRHKSTFVAALFTQISKNVDFITGSTSLNCVFCTFQSILSYKLRYIWLFLPQFDLIEEGGEMCGIEYNYKSSFFITHHGSSEFWLLTTFHFCLCCCFPSWQLNISVSTAQISIVCVLVKVSFLFFPRRIISLKITQIFH